jgi:cell division protein FtsI (penicillin-binding protein 3)
VAEERNSRFRLPWIPAQRVARRETGAAPIAWRDTLRSRIIVCASVFALWTVGIEARLLYLQVAQHAWFITRLNRQQLSTIEPAAKRGEILDRNGRVLAYSVDGEALTADPSEVENPDKAVRQICAALDACDGAKLKDLAAKLKENRDFVWLERQLSPNAARRIRALGLKGVAFHKESRRYYPNLELAAHVLGYVGIDNVGLGGLEAAYDARIRGKVGRLLLQKDAHNNAMSVREERPATAGDSLELTIDQYLQHIAERELKAGVDEHNAAGGTAIIMQPQTGEILALANYPTFNPNAYRRSPENNRKNRATQDVYEPGSTFKLVTASAALEEGVLNATDIIDCSPGFITFPGRKPIREAGGHMYGAISFEDVIVKSSNVGAIKAGLKIGPERLSRYINRFGFGQALGPDFKGETRGIVWPADKLNPSALASISMGYQVGVTPLQMAAAVSSVANGGTLIEPRVVRAFIHKGRREPVPTKVLHRTVSAETAATMTQIMEAVVERGTAKSAQIEGYTIAGKTGTAAKTVNGGGYSTSDYNTSFIGFVPSRKPALTIIVVIDSPHGKVRAYGGTVAAPIFQRIAEASLRHIGVGPTINAPPPVIVTRNKSGDGAEPIGAADPAAAERMLASAREGLMPDLRGLGAREALKSLTRAGLTGRIAGDGVVVEQSPLPGTVLTRGDAALLKLARRMPILPAGGTQQ